MNLVHWMRRIRRPTNRSVLLGFRLAFQVILGLESIYLPGCVAAGFSAGGLQPKPNRGGLGRESEGVEFGNPPLD